MASMEPCGKDVREIVDTQFRDFHLARLGIENPGRIQIDLLFYQADKNDDGDIVGPPLKLHGYPAAAVISVVPLKWRALGRGDVLIVIDEATWEESSHEENEALIDHELEHIDIIRKEGEIQYDKVGRPRVKMRLHDVDFGWFVEVARRKTAASSEVRQAKRIYDKWGQYLFPFAVGTPKERTEKFLGVRGTMGHRAATAPASA